MRTGRAHVERKQLHIHGDACFSNEAKTQPDARMPEPAVMFPWNPFGDVTWNSVTSVQWSYFGCLYLYIPPPPTACSGLTLTVFVCSGCSSASHSVPVDPVIIAGRAETRASAEGGSVSGAAALPPLNPSLPNSCRDPGRAGPGWDEKNTLLRFHLCRAAAGVQPAQMAAEGRRRGEINSRCERCTDPQRGRGSARTQPDPPEPLSSDLFVGET